MAIRPDSAAVQFLSSFRLPGGHNAGWPLASYAVPFLAEVCLYPGRVVF